MGKKSTEELKTVLSQTATTEIDGYLARNAESFVAGEKAFCLYMHEMLRRYGKTQQQVFLQADLPERFGYKLLSEEKRTKQRDYIIRICYAMGMTLDETQRALTLYGMAPLYPRIPRDAVLMIAINRCKGSILDVDALLVAHGMPALKSPGSLE